jgi:hypothetical protein
MDTIIRYKILRRKNKVLKVELSRRGTGNAPGPDRFQTNIYGDQKILRVIPVNVRDAQETKADTASSSLN